MRLAYLFLGFASSLLFGCKDNPDYCAGHPSDTTCMADGGGSGSVDAPGCTGDPMCASPTPSCVVDTGTCVECTAGGNESECTGMKPACGDDHACRACSTHADCSASAACLPDGSCGDDSNVAYVDPSGSDNTTCTKSMPCTKVSKALATSRPFVKFHGTTNEQVYAQPAESSRN